MRATPLPKEWKDAITSAQEGDIAARLHTFDRAVDALTEIYLAGIPMPTIVVSPNYDIVFTWLENFDKRTLEVTVIDNSQHGLFSAMCHTVSTNETEKKLFPPFCIEPMMTFLMDNFKEGKTCLT